MLLTIDLIDGCAECDAEHSVEERRYRMDDETVQRTYRCLACGWHDMSIHD